MNDDLALDPGGTPRAVSAPMPKRALPKYTYIKQGKIWFRIKYADGVWRAKPTPYTPHSAKEIELARRLVAEKLRVEAARVESAIEPPADGTMTVRAYLERWLKDREARDVACAVDDRARLENYAIPYIGDVPLEELRPRHVRDMVRTLRALKGDDTLAPRTILHVFRVLHNAIANAVVDELITENPVKVKRGELPSKVDKDPEWRSQATYTLAEVEQLISAPIIPIERRVQYALKAIVGMRHGEIAALCWRHIDESVEPLAKLNIVQAYCSRERHIKSTKTENTRAVPVHPTLAKILKTWRDVHWPRIYGREPTADDFVVPTRNMTPINVADAGHAMQDDLDALEFRREAGKFRQRGGHDLRSWYKTRCIEDGADSLIIRRTTHKPPTDVDGGYERFSWATICREVAKLQISISDEKLAESIPSRFLLEARAANRWQKVVTPSGLEPSSQNSRVIRMKGLSTTNSNEGTSRVRNARRLRNRLITNPKRYLGTAADMLEKAIRSGDTARALRVIHEMKADADVTKEQS